MLKSLKIIYTCAECCASTAMFKLCAVIPQMVLTLTTNQDRTVFEEKRMKALLLRFPE